MVRRHVQPELETVWSDLELDGSPATVEFSARGVVAIATRDNSEKRCWGDVDSVELVDSRPEIVVDGGASECSVAAGPRALVFAYAPPSPAGAPTEVLYNGRPATEGING